LTAAEEHPDAGARDATVSRASFRSQPQEAVLPPPLRDYVLDLETALGLASVENPTIALAEEAVQASRAEQLRARALLLPTLNAGVDFDLHRGNLESGRGIIRDVNKESLYAGAGAAVVGAGTVNVPGVWIFSHLGDVLYEPLATRQRVTGRRFDALATRNTILLEVTTRYFALVGAEERLRVILQSEQDLGVIVQLTADFARSGQGREGDAERARTEAQLLRREEESAQEEVAVAAADLARLLNVDPAIRLRGTGEPIPLIQLIDPRDDLEKLVQIALLNRPELGARAADVAENEIRLRQERVRPWLPVLSAGFSAGQFGGGSNQVTPRFGDFNGRTDFDVSAVWSLENFGLGNLAVQRQRHAQVNEAEAERTRVADQIRREVADALALSAARRQQVDVAKRQLQTAGQGYRLDLIRARNIEGHPIEVLNSVNLLSAARQEYVRAVIGYNQAQFALFVSLGQPPPAANTDGKLCP
jgi:outer membrane protein TolC